jgi:hypothetical protein
MTLAAFTEAVTTVVTVRLRHGLFPDVLTEVRLFCHKGAYL